MGDWNRRTFLSTFGVTGLAGLAGCGDRASSDAEDDPSPTQEQPTLTVTDTASPPSTPETEPPVIDAYEAAATSIAGELIVELGASDNKELERAVIRTSIDEVERVLDGRKDTVTSRIQGRPGEVEQISLLLEDKADNQSREVAESYVRNYDVMEDTRLDVAVDYFTLGERMFSQCLTDSVEAEPDIAYHATPIEPRTTSKQVDAMRGHGITRLQFTFAGAAEEIDMLDNFLAAELINDIDLMAGYFLGGGHRRGEDAGWREKVEADMPILQERILSRDNAATHDGRPIFIAAHVGRWVAEQDYMMDEWGSYENFVDDLRSLLAVDGTEPYMIAGYGSSGYHGFGDTHAALARQFDAVGSGKAGPILRGSVPAEETLDYVEENFKGHHDFATEHDLDFVPLVFPGFDDRANTCWGLDRYIPRSLDRFGRMLDLADKYRTTDLITIDTWNDWTEGTQIEPGTYRGEEYGTAYLDIVREFQQGGST